MGSLKVHRGPFSWIWEICLGFHGAHRLGMSHVPAGPGQESLAEKANFPTLDQARQKYLRARKCHTNKYVPKQELMPSRAPSQG